MAIMAECPVCHRKQGNRNKKCVQCGIDIAREKNNDKVRFWITYRLNKKQIWEPVSVNKETGKNSADDARASDGKRRAQKKEKRLSILDIKPELAITFQELTDWYLSCESVKVLHSSFQISNSLRKFNLEFGHRKVREIKPSELENYKVKRKQAGAAESTIDQEIGAAKTAVNNAFYDKKIDGDTLINFKRIKKYLTGKRKNSNARDRVLSHSEFLAILYHLPVHSRGIFTAGYYTGMRLGEILSLTWGMVSLKDRKITLPKEITKDDEERIIPIGDVVYSLLKKIPTPIHDDHVFLNNGKPVKDIRGGLEGACEKAKVIYGRFIKDGFIEHDLRHTFVTNMRKAAVHNAVTNAITGHSEGTMRERYDAVSLEDMMDGIKKLEAFLESVNQNVNKTTFGQEKEVNQMAANLLN